MLSPSFCIGKSGHDFTDGSGFKVSYLARNEVRAVLEAPLGRIHFRVPAMCTQVTPLRVVALSDSLAPLVWLIENFTSSLPRASWIWVLQLYHFGHIVFVRKESFWASVQSRGWVASECLPPSGCYSFIFTLFSGLHHSILHTSACITAPQKGF